MAAVQLLKTESTTPATFPLNYDCVFEVFLRLGLDECMSLAEAYDGLQPIADRIFKRKFNKLVFDFEQPIDRILYHAGPTVKSLTLNLNTPFGYTESDLMKIGETCKDVQCLTINGFNNQKIVNDPFVVSTTTNPFNHISNEHLEMLTLNSCYLANDDNFFEAHKNLKCLNFNRCQTIEAIAIKKCFENNREIKSFTCDSQFIFVAELLQLLPNLERLSLRYISRFMKLNSLSKLQSLRHLTLICWDDNVNRTLSNLAKLNILEELVLIDVTVDENTFPIIKQLERLQLLSVTTHDSPFPASADLPKNLKALRLGGFHIDEKDMTSTVDQLKHLQDIHLQNCDLTTEYLWVTDFDEMAEFIIKELDTQTHRHLNVAVTSAYDHSPEVITQ